MHKETKKVNPDISYILNRGKETSTDIGIIFPGFDDYNSMSSYLYPTAPTDKVLSATIFFNILYFIDDYFGEDTRGERPIPDNKELMIIWNADKLDQKADTSLNQTLFNSIYKLKELIGELPSNVRKQITETLFDHIKDAFNPRVYSTLDDYINTRLRFSGMLLSVDMISYLYSIDTEKILSNSQELRDTRILCGEIGSLANDIFSYPKETESDFNLVNVLIKLGICNSIPEAIDQAISIVNSKYEEFTTLYNYLDKAFSSNTKALNKYLDALRDIVSASYFWQVDSNRYRNVSHFFSNMK